MPALSRSFRTCRAPTRSRRLFLEPLEDRLLLAATITVNSTLDTDARDDVLTLREAIEVSNLTLDVASLTTQEQAQVIGTPTSNDTDTVAFNIPAPLPPTSRWSAEQSANDSLDGNDGVLGTGTTFSPGVRGSAFKFDGITGDVSIPDAPNLKPSFFTLDAWVRFDDLDSPGAAAPGLQYIVFKQNVRSAADGNFEAYALEKLRFGGADHLAFIMSSEIVNTVTLLSTTTVSTGQFYHVAATYDGALARLYINGTQENAATPGPLSYGTLPLFFGSSGDPSFDGKLKGVLDEVELYDRALSPAEVEAIYQSGVVNLSAANIAPTPTALYRAEGNANDSINGNAGALVNGAGFALGIVGQAFNLDGVDDRVDIPDATTLNPTSAITLDAWIYPKSLSKSYNAVIAKSGSTRGYGMWITSDGRIHVEGSGFSSSYARTAPATIPLNAWTHVAAIIAAGTGFHIYVNGVEQPITAAGTPTLDASAPPLIIGASDVNPTDRDYGDFAFSGLIDEAAVYSQALTQAQIQAQIADALTPKSRTIYLSSFSSLPTITDPVIIDGYTQPGAHPNTNGAGLGSNALLLIELNCYGSDGLVISSGHSTIRGLAINNFDFSASAIALTKGGNNVIEGNYLGTDLTGALIQSHGAFGLEIRDSPDNLIGGTTPAARNIISGNGFGIGVATSGDAPGNIIQGNFIGVDSTGTIALPNKYDGIRLERAAGSQIGGTEAGAGNVIASNYDNNISVSPSASDTLIQGNMIGTDVTGTKVIMASLNLSTSAGVMVSGLNTTIGGAVPGAGNVIGGAFYYAQSGIFIDGGSGTVIQGNWIGTDKTGTIDLRNVFGIFIDASANLVGGPDPSDGNTIAFNFVGVKVTAGQQNAILGNSIFRNSLYDNTILGIDLGHDRTTANDSLDSDSGPNNLQNFPEIGYATKSSGMLKVTYTVPSDPTNSTYPIRVEFFKADAAGKTGQTYFGFDIFTADDYAAGGKTSLVPMAASINIFDKIVATATDSLATGEPANTSEFSFPNATLVSPWINPRNRLDVNDDTHVAANDVAAVINYIDAFKSGPVPDNADNSQPYLDVNGDNNIAPNDALDIINAINAGQGGEGDDGTDNTALQSAADNLFALLANDQFAQSQQKR
jgi:hypothetical protein